MTGYLLSETAASDLDTLARTPGIGHRREDLTSPPILFRPIGAYLILYRHQAKAIEIIAVTQGARDIPTFLSQRIS
jgi:toxin ParE1/3/4